MQIIYNKLVRDNIPQIIKADGKVPVTRILDDKEYMERLKDKLMEEAGEFSESGSLEELADVLEVVYALLDAMGKSRAEFQDVREDKAKKNGAFEERILLERVEG